MLKIIPATTNCGCGYFKSKCAEIHYQTSSFSILCIFCGITTESYAIFLEHFRSQHFEDFTTALQSTAEPVVTPIYEEEVQRENQAKSLTKKQRNYHDPLDFSEREIFEDPEEVMKKLLLQENQLEMKQLKFEEELEFLPEIKQNNCEENTLSGKNIVEQRLQLEDDDAEFNASDEEFLICKVKVEQSDLQAINPIKGGRSQKRLTKIKNDNTSRCRSGYDVAEDLDNIATTSKSDEVAALGGRHNNKDCDDDEEFWSTDSQECDAADGGDVDWTKPYEPNLLRNHEKRPYKPRNKPNNCSYCGRTFRRRYQLDTHLNIHTGRKPHQCDICGRQFRAVTTLTRHLNTHAQREAFQCKFCAKVFTHKAALLSHELRHTQERRVPCDECDKFFYTLNQMDTHKRKVHHKSDDTTAAAATSLPFACDLCTKRYRSASMLSTHKFKKHYKTAKFVCEQCGKKCIDEQKLDAHKRIHVDGLLSAEVDDLSPSKHSGQVPL